MSQTKSAAQAAPSKNRDEMKHLGVPFQVKADSLDDATRSFTGLASTWDLDLGGDVIHKGAFKRTLNNWHRSKSVLPLLDSHSAYGTVRAIVGRMIDAKETDEGLVATFEVIDGPDGDEIWRRIKGGYVTGLSIGYRAIKIEAPSEEEQRAGVWRHLKEVELREVSVVVWPMNPAARIDKGSMKALAADVAALEEAAACRDLTDEEKAELAELNAKIEALLDEGGVTPKTGGTPPEEPPLVTPPAEKEGPAGLAPDDPGRLEMEARLAEHRLRVVGTHARTVRA
ncbi:MAG: hypothetical protein AMXMBFR53_30040 [Gemmatimonadota bacterium]